MAVIRLYSHAPSDTIQRLKASLIEAGHSVKKLKTVGGSYIGRNGHTIFNYGSSNLPEATVGAANVLNKPLYITRASNKRDAFARMEQGNVRTVEYTTQRQIAEQWAREGALVYARTRLQGHSGEGIELISTSGATVNGGGIPVHNEVINAPLYTKGILGNRREYRVHVFAGKIIHVAQKRRRDGFADIEGNNNLVRNWHTGWVYSTQNMTALNNAGKCEALKAVAALGLDFGAVDIITNREQAWVLEVNTAPGMEGVTLEKYVAAISAVATGSEVEGETVENFADFRQVVEPVNPNASDRTPEQRAQGNRPNAVNTETQRNGNVTATNQQAAQTTATTQPRAAAQTTAAASTQTRNQPQRNTASRSALTDGQFFFISVAGEETVGKYYAATNDFEIVGWEPHVERDEVTVLEAIERSR